MEKVTIDRDKFIRTMQLHNVNAKILALMSGVSEVTICSLKKGNRCHYQTALKISNALNVPLENLLVEEQHSGESVKIC